MLPTLEYDGTFGPVPLEHFTRTLLMSTDFTPLGIPDVLLIQTTCHTDERGYFSETYRRSAFTRINTEFVQDNFVRSDHRVLRGLHFQLPPKAQGKLVRVVRGEIFDVAVDLRTGSDTFSQWVGIQMTADEGVQLWIPPGFAHGYVVLSELGADVAYKATHEYDSGLETGIRWDDPQIGISWPISDPILSSKDQQLPSLAESNLGAR
jgi:dTDP-4-dehydrorhamnose 3,5-epimerase